MLLIARTDARQSLGFDEAITRLQEAIRIGVDIAFFEAPQSTEEMERVCNILAGVPVLLNLVPGGVTPEVSVEEARRMGFRIVIYPGVCIGAVVEGLRGALEGLKSGRLTEGGKGGGGVKEAFNLCGLQECIEIDRGAGGKDYATVGE